MRCPQYDIGCYFNQQAHCDFFGNVECKDSFYYPQSMIPDIGPSTNLNQWHAPTFLPIKPSYTIPIYNNNNNINPYYDPSINTIFQYVPPTSSRTFVPFNNVFMYPNYNIPIRQWTYYQ
eukprot:Pgem_evm9s14806